VIAPQVHRMWIELYECAYRKDAEARVRALQLWHTRWVIEMHASHTFSRDILHAYSEHKSGIAEMIMEKKWGVLEQDYAPHGEYDEPPNPITREDRLSIYILGNNNDHR
jgi:hypothetical protein